MDPDIDCQISEHVLRMHQFRSAIDGGEAAHDGSARNGREEEADTESSVFVKYNRMLHGKKTDRGCKRDTLTIKFLKKYIHYAKHRIQPDLTDEASDQIATTYAELRNAKTRGTLPITARTLETIICLSTAHAKLKLSRRVFDDPTSLTEEGLYELRNSWATCFLDLYNPEVDYDVADDEA
ncbi:unnamed protein product [Trifolium pratense]|uniref:Uncharacterized protein n=1 Tax=Trifolium pratense TaxID=57577 RepID=A0ACB0LPI5_TRIPR|nr:unnamed protein product [Trifolium pratense]